MKKNYKVTIEDENGKVIKQIDSDCIIAAISDVKDSTIAGVFATNCDTNTMVNAFATLDRVKKEAYESNPLLVFAELIGKAKPASKCEDEDAGKGFAEFLSKLINT